MAIPRPVAPPLESRRAEICRTAAQIFRDRGFDATSVSDVARALGMTKAGLYHYFDSKEALLFEIMNYGLDRVRDEVIVKVSGIVDPEERLRELVLRHASIATTGKGAVSHLNDEIRALPPGSRRLIEERMRKYVDLLYSTLVELKDTGRLRDVDPTVAAFSTIGMILWLPRWFRQDGRLTQQQAAKEIQKLALGALLKPAPRSNGNGSARARRLRLSAARSDR
jgi:TetR/AcrR family transcriptional regulator, cholesterol catabolism regulator